MNSLDIKKSSKSNHKAKPNLKNELAEAQKQLKKQTEKLNECTNKLQNAEIKILELEKLKTKFGSSEADLNQSLEELEVMIKQSDHIKQNINELEISRQKLKEENERLKKQLNETHLESSNHDTEIGTKLRETEKQNIQLVKKVQELENTIVTLEKKLVTADKLEKIELNGIMAPKATFRIELYKREKDYRGRIDHPLTKDQRIFTGLDKDTIIEFISSHLPHTEELTKNIEDTSQLRETKIIPVDLNIPNRMAYHDQTFKINLKLDLTEINIKHNAPLTCNVTIYAKSLGGGKRQIVAETREIIKSSGVFKIELLAKALSEGTYLVDGSVISNIPGEISTPASSFVRGGILNVQ